MDFEYEYYKLRLTLLGICNTELQEAAIVTYPLDDYDTGIKVGRNRTAQLVLNALGYEFVGYDENNDVLIGAIDGNDDSI